MYIRISLMVPKHGQFARAGELLDEIARYCFERPGCLHSYRLGPDEASGVIGRVTVWADQRRADEVLRGGRMLSLRANLDALIRTHSEHGLVAEELSAASSLSAAAALREVQRLLGPDVPADEYHSP